MGIKGEDEEKRGAEKGKECSGDGRQKERWYSWEKKNGGRGRGYKTKKRRPLTPNLGKVLFLKPLEAERKIT